MNSRPRGAKEAIQSVAHRCIADLVEKELVALAKIVRNESTIMTESEVTSVHIEKITSDMQAAAPILWSLLDKIAQSESQRTRNTKKTPEKVSITCYFTQINMPDSPTQDYYNCPFDVAIFPKSTLQCSTENLWNVFQISTPCCPRFRCLARTRHHNELILGNKELECYRERQHGHDIEVY